jgi:hypothetical protein
MVYGEKSRIFSESVTVLSPPAAALDVSAGVSEGGDMEAIKIEMDTSAIRQWLAAWKQFPREAGKWAAKLVNDEAFEFKARFPEVIRSRYTIRDLAFIMRIIRIEKARPRSHMPDIVAAVGTWYGSTGESGFGGSSIRFSGFEEELTRRPSAVARPHHRVITDAGRVGRAWTGKAAGWARMHPNQKIPSIIDTTAGLQKVPEESRFAAMIRMMAEGKIAHSPSNTFILEGGKYKRGLYRFKGGKLPVKEAFHEGKDKVEMIQLFKDKPILPPRWDWQKMTVEKVKEKFTPDYIAANYIAKAILGIMPEKKPWTGS